MEVDTSRTLRRIAFGSCNKHDKPQVAWARVIARRPDVWVWLGDIMYADAPVFLKYRIPASAEKVTRYYQLQKAVPEYQALLQAVPVVGVYDDHDYGANDGTKYYDPIARSASSRALMDFLDEPADSPRRERAARQEGVFTSYVFGQRPRRVKLILLDNRTNRDPKDDPRGAQDMLGPAQWKWLEEQLAGEKTEITIIGTGIQILARSDPLIAENWSQLPQSQARLLALLARTNTTGAFFITGDVHYAELNRLTCAPVGYPLYDLTSSGLTHSWGGFPKSTAVDMALMAPTRVKNWYDGRNWGEIDIDWATRCTAAGTVCDEANNPDDIELDIGRTNITLRVWGVDDGLLHIQHLVPLSELQPAASIQAHDAAGLGYRYLANGKRTPEYLANMSIADAVKDCAGPQPSLHGYTDECARVMLSCTPGISTADAAYYMITHIILAIGALAALLVVFCAPAAAWKLGPRVPGGRTAAFAVIAAMYAGCVAFIVSLH